jgi:hypothetical protein
MQKLHGDKGCTNYFILNPTWLKENKGFIRCQKCSTEIGYYDRNGMACNCGKTVKPGFKIYKTMIMNLD